MIEHWDLGPHLCVFVKSSRFAECATEDRTCGDRNSATLVNARSG